MGVIYIITAPARQPPGSSRVVVAVVVVVPAAVAAAPPKYVGTVRCRRVNVRPVTIAPTAIARWHASTHRYPTSVLGFEIN